MEKLQGDISRMLVMLQSLTIPENSRHKLSNQIEITHDATAIITASNLSEVKHPDIHIEVLEDGCKVTCNTCKQFRLSQQRKMKVLHIQYDSNLVYVIDNMLLAIKSFNLSSL